MVMESQLRNQLAASVRSINWSYALFWSISSTQPAPGILTWTDGFYNGEVKTTKIANSAKLTANQLIMRRSEQLRELYEALCSGKCDRRAARPVASLSPQDLGNTEWYYMVSMTYAFRPGQGLPGRCFASNERVWMGNAHLAHNKAFPRAILAQSTSIQTIVCIPLMGGVLELGATHEVVEDPDLIRRATAAFWGMQFPACSEEPSSSRLASERGKPAGDIIVFKEIDHIFMEAMIAGDEQELGEAESLSDASLEHITTEIDQFYSLCDVQALDDTWIMDGSFEVPSLPQQALGAAASATNNIAATSSAAVDGPRETCFTAWARPESDSDEAAVLVVEEPQKLLRKAVGGRAWAANNGGGSTTRTDEEGGIKNHILTERKRREKLNKMFLILKSLVPSIDKVDKASILAETIAYLKELQQRVQELESSREPMISHPSETTKATKRHDDDETVRMGSGSKRKGSELGSGVEREHPCVLSEDGSSRRTSSTKKCDQTTMRPLVVLGLVLVFAAGVALEGAAAAGECGRASADRVALRLAPCISAADDPQSTPTSSCCSAVHTIGQSPSCLCAVMLSGTARAAGIKPEVAITIPKRCNMADRPVGYKCGEYTLP